MEAESEESPGAREKYPDFPPEARRELERLLSDPDFQCTDRNKKFLRYVAEALFQGREHTVKAYSIAVDVFGRPSNFDPSIDPIVRIEATRLRAALLRYYERPGHDSTIKIELPRGRYLPMFSGVSGSDGTTLTGGGHPEPRAYVQANREINRLHPKRGMRSVAIFCGLVGGALLGIGLLLPVDPFGASRLPEISDKPRVSLEVQSVDQTSDSDAARFRDDLMIALSRFQTVHLSAPDITSDVKQVSSAAGALLSHKSKYRLLVKYQSDISKTSVVWQVIDRDSGELIRSGNDQAIPDRLAQKDAEQELASQLAVRFASERGVISNVETTREMAHPTLGNGCLLRAGLAPQTDEREHLRQIRNCVERTLEVRPGDPDAFALLSLLVIRQAADPRSGEQALAYARHSVMLAPDSDRSRFALMLAQFNEGNVDAAVSEGYSALGLNPNNLAGMAKLARILFMIGRWDEGAALARKADRFEYMAYPDAEMTLGFDAFRRQNFEEALLRLRQVDARDDYMTQLLCIATLAYLGRIDEAHTAIDELRSSRAKFEETFQADMADERLAPSLVSSLASGLTRAGLTLH